MRKTVLSVMCAVIFLTVAMVPALASDVKVNIYESNDKGLNHIAVEAEQSDIDILLTDIQTFRTWLETNRPFKDFKLSEDEITEIKSLASDVVDSLNSILIKNGQDPIEASAMFREIFETELGRSTILSVGKGYAFIPFYDYETFLGIMLRPIWLLYPPLFLLGGGYTGNFNLNGLPPRIEYGDRLGMHIVRTTMFSGWFINLGDLGYNQMTPGTMILLGNARVVLS